MNQKIEWLISEELQRAREKFPAATNSSHEGYAVLLEEIEELEEDFTTILHRNVDLWKAVKTDNPDQQHKIINRIRAATVRVIKEAVQVAAMADKYEIDLFSVQTNYIDFMADKWDVPLLPLEEYPVGTKIKITVSDIYQWKKTFSGWLWNGPKGGEHAFPKSGDTAFLVSVPITF